MVWFKGKPVMSIKSSERAKEDFDLLSSCYFKVYLYFRKDVDRTRIWFLSPNPVLGDINPIEMFRRGRVRKLLKFINMCIGDD